MKHLRIVLKILFGLALIGGTLPGFSQEIEDIEPDPVCEGDMITITGTGLNSVNRLSFSLHNTTHSLDIETQSDESITTTIPDLDGLDGDITIEAFGSNSTVLSSRSITVNNIPDIDIDEDNFDKVLCQRVKSSFNLVDIEGDANEKYFWNFGNGFTDSLDNPVYSYTYSDVGSFDITVWVTDEGCRSKDTSVTVVVNPPPVASILNPPTDVCTNQLLTFTATAEGLANPSYAWNFGDGDSVETSNDTVSYTYTQIDNFTVTLQVTNEEGCTSKKDSAEVAVSDGPAVSIMVDSENVSPLQTVDAYSDIPTSIQIDSGNAMVIWTATLKSGLASGFATEGTDLQFRPTFMLPDMEEEALIEYVVTVNAAECSSSFRFSLKITQPFFIANFVSPNGDTFNDNWHVQINDPDLFPNGVYVKIFNRTGTKVYEDLAEVSQGLLTEPWDGGDCPDGAYWYIISDAEDNPKINITGSVTLLRGGQ